MLGRLDPKWVLSISIEVTWQWEQIWALGSCKLCSYPAFCLFFGHLKGWSQIHLQLNIHKQVHPLSQDQSCQTSLSPCWWGVQFSQSFLPPSSLIKLSRPNTYFCILLAMDSSFGPIYSISSLCALKHPNLTSDYSVPMTTKNVGYFSYKQTVSWLITGKNGYFRSLTGIFPGGKCRYSRLSRRLCYSQQRCRVMNDICFCSTSVVYSVWTDCSPTT